MIKIIYYQLSVISCKLPKIYPITDTRIARLSHAEQVKRLVEGGAMIVQLREKYASQNDFYADAKEVLKFARNNGVKVIINDRVDIALALKADGVHLGQDDLPPERARKILGEKAIIGFSTHNLEQAEKAIRLPINYLAIGPIFNTRTKDNPDETIGIENIKKLREAIRNFPLVAIGGITLMNFRDVLSQGADSVAVISDLLDDANKITEKMLEFLKISNSYVK